MIKKIALTAFTLLLILSGSSFSIEKEDLNGLLTDLQAVDSPFADQDLCEKTLKKIELIRAHVIENGRVSKGINQLVDTLLRNYEDGILTFTDIRIKRGNFDADLPNLITKLKKLKEENLNTRPSPIKIQTIFKEEISEEALSTPIKVKGNTFNFLKEFHPTPNKIDPKDPRKKNLRLLWNGKNPRMKGNLTTEFHHCAQEYEDDIYPLSKKFHKNNHGPLHYLGKKYPSKIDRKLFRKVKKQAGKVHVLSRFRQLLTERINVMKQVKSIDLKNTVNSSVVKKLIF